MTYWSELVYLISNTDHRCLVFGLNNCSSKYSCLFDLKYLVHGMDNNRRKMLDVALFLASRLLEPLNPGKEGGKILLGGSHVGRQLLLGGVQQGQVVPKLGC